MGSLCSLHSVHVIYWSYHVTRQAGEGVDAAQGRNPHFLFRRKSLNSIISRPPWWQVSQSKADMLKWKDEWCTMAGLVVRASRRVKRASNCAVRAGGGSRSSGWRQERVESCTASSGQDSASRSSGSNWAATTIQAKCQPWKFSNRRSSCNSSCRSRYVTSIRTGIMSNVIEQIDWSTYSRKLCELHLSGQIIHNVWQGLQKHRPLLWKRHTDRNIIKREY